MADKEHFGFLDGIRGVAILGVVFHHAYYLFGMSDEIVKLVKGCQDPGVGALLLLCKRVLDAIASHGTFGVDLFLVISGFLITGLLIDFLQDRLDIGRFYLRRFFKIVPHYYFTLIAVLVFCLFMNPLVVWPYLWRAIIPHFFFLQNFGFNVTGLEHTWSLVVEEQFYIFWALALLYISKRWSVEKTRWNAAVWTAIGFCLFITLNRYLVFSMGTSLISVYPVSGVLQVTSVRADGLMAGCFLRLMWTRYPGLFQGKAKAVFLSLIGGVVFLCLLNMPLVNWATPTNWYTVTLAWATAFCFICAGLGGANLFWRNSGLRFTGRNSYGIYLLHYPLLQAMLIWSRGRVPWLFWIYVPLAIFVGALSTMTIEKYFLELRKKVSP